MLSNNLKCILIGVLSGIVMTVGTMVVYTQYNDSQKIDSDQTQTVIDSTKDRQMGNEDVPNQESDSTEERDLSKIPRIFGGTLEVPNDTEGINKSKYVLSGIRVMSLGDGVINAETQSPLKLKQLYTIHTSQKNEIKKEICTIDTTRDLGLMHSCSLESAQNTDIRVGDVLTVQSTEEIQENTTEFTAEIIIISSL